jgi:hypothetical protein
VARFRKPSAAVTQTEEFCRCPPSHNLSMHDEKGCTAEVIIFRCANYKFNSPSRPHDHKDCMMKVPCRCRVPNIPDKKGRTIGEAIQEAEKVTA